MSVIRKAWKEAKELEGMPAYCAPVTLFERMPYWFRVIGTFILITWWDMRSAVLCRNGHDYQELDGSPESGSFYGECSRCGKVISGHW